MAEVHLGRESSRRSAATLGRPGVAWPARPLLIVGLALALNLAGNDRVGLWDRDEPRYATCTREMRARGDWLHPTFNGQPRYHKPILIYWLMRAGYRRRRRQPVRGPAGLGPRRGGDLPGRLAARAGRSSGPSGRPARRRLALATVADHGRRVEAGDDRRDPGPAGRRGPGAASGGSGRRDSRRLAAGFWVVDGAGDPAEGAGRAGPGRGLGAWPRGGGAGRRPAGGGSAGGPGLWLCSWR